MFLKKLLCKATISEGKYQAEKFARARILPPLQLKRILYRLNPGGFVCPHSPVWTDLSVCLSSIEPAEDESY